MTMAEVLGVVASGIAVGQAAGAIGSAVLKIKRLCDGISNITEKVQYLLDQLEVLKPIIEHTDAVFALPDANQNSHMHQPGIRKAAASCQRASLELEALATEINARLAVSSRMRKKIAGVKAVLKKEELGALERRLESAVWMLNAAQNLHLMHLVGSLPEVVVAQLETRRVITHDTIVEESSESGEVVSSGTEPSADTQSKNFTSSLESQDVWDQPSKYGQIACKPSPGGFKARIVTPFTGSRVQRAWELLVSRSYLGWKVALQPIIHSPDLNLLCKLAEAGAIGNLQHLFRSGHAVIDTSEKYHTDILQSGVKGGLSTVQMLLSCGIRCYSSVAMEVLRMVICDLSGGIDSNGLLCVPLDDLSGGIYPNDLSRCKDSPWLQLVFSGGLGEVSPSYLELRRTYFLATLEILVNLMTANGLLQNPAKLKHSFDSFDRVFSVRDGLSFDDRLYLSRIVETNHLREDEIVQTFRLALRSTGELSPDHILKGASCSALPLAAYNWARLLARDGSPSESWVQVLHEIASLKTLTIGNDGCDIGRTPLQAMVNGFVNGSLISRLAKWPGDSALASALNQWLELLFRLGIELEVYGAWEQNFLRDFPHRWKHVLCGRHWCGPWFGRNMFILDDPERSFEDNIPSICLQRLVVGPQPADWAFEWESCEEEWPLRCDEWEDVENTQQEENKALDAWLDMSPGLPGSWVD